MATSKPGNKGVQIGGFNVWWDNGDHIHMQLNERDSDLPKGAPWVTFSNPDSGNYHPGELQPMCCRLFGRKGKLPPSPYLKRLENSTLAALCARTDLSFSSVPRPAPPGSSVPLSGTG